MLSLLLILARVVAGVALLPQVKAKDWAGEPYPWLYSCALPIPPLASPKMNILNPVTNNTIQYFEIDIEPFSQQIYPNKNATDLVGYNGMSPGPTFLIQRGQETVVRFVNKHTKPSAVHVHGSPTRAPWDGWADDTFLPDEYKDYYYPNFQSARTIWYHDHAVDITAVNAYFGQAGAYIIHDPDEDKLGLPSGYGTYDLPMILMSKEYKPDGQLISPAGNTVSLYGDVIHVNGQPWPFHDVEPRKYRFRTVNAAISRAFDLYFVTEDDDTTRIPFQVVGSDSGLLSEPVTTDSLHAGMGERWDVVFDFAPYAGTNITMRNQDNVGGDAVYINTDKVMRFVVSGDKVADTSKVPSDLRDLPTLPAKDTPAYSFEFAVGPDNNWLINGVGFDDVANRILARPPRGTVELWELKNGAGGLLHPVHVHLVDFKVKSRTGGQNRGVQEYEAKGFKDVVWLDRDETVIVEAWYAPWDGVYMFHCHNLVHEDHYMMDAFNVTQITDLGYNETEFNDPMEARWRGKPVDSADFTPEAITDTVQYMASLKPYSDWQEVEEKLKEYWAAHGGEKKKARRVRRSI
ncbi:hypothetical protein E8E14_010640 [Neopestalotiopsis sp. 37M]|nr:hypothetical protein E8E14_010640 [Neopestalotiopsis sp. 37M]